jgi:hypothetical protein
MSWKPLTDLQVLEEFTPAEKNVLQNIQSQEALPGILQRTIDAARGSISAGGNPLGQEGTIPDQVAMHVIAIARWRWLVSAPELKRLQTPERKALHDEGNAMLDKIANGKPKTEIPTDPVTTASPINGIQIVRPGRYVETESFDNLGNT